MGEIKLRRYYERWTYREYVGDTWKVWPLYWDLANKRRGDKKACT